MKIVVTDMDLAVLQAPFWTVALNICNYLDGEYKGRLYPASFFGALASLRGKHFEIVDVQIAKFPALCFSDMLFTCVALKRNVSYADAFLLMKNIGNDQGDFQGDFR